MDYGSFIDQVAGRAGISSVQAERLTRAVLATLSDRCTGGEAFDLAACLPDPLPEILRPYPGDEAGDRFDAAEFIRRVSHRAGVETPTARAGIRAVFTAVRLALPTGEFDDVLIQMPRDYRDLVEPALTARSAFRSGTAVTPPPPTPATVRSVRHPIPVR